MRRQLANIYLELLLEFEINLLQLAAERNMVHKQLLIPALAEPLDRLGRQEPERPGLERNASDSDFLNLKQLRDLVAVQRLRELRIVAAVNIGGCPERQRMGGLTVNRSRELRPRLVGDALVEDT